ncbi:hypothetical protein DFH07DRAFT_970124 [Mycena maculata]|uniref:Uncharacterized protein n=1 Tax=Mycena maculata TaxID=230809 RepID=A0AAD7HSR6_9AGAR|nr:hypothetical protein DFH07DRAFT_970124 [Mycena maculata]
MACELRVLFYGQYQILHCLYNCVHASALPAGPASVLLTVPALLPRSSLPPPPPLLRSSLPSRPRLPPRPSFLLCSSLPRCCSLPLAPPMPPPLAAGSVPAAALLAAGSVPAATLLRPVAPATAPHCPRCPCLRTPRDRTCPLPLHPHLFASPTPRTSHCPHAHLAAVLIPSHCVPHALPPVPFRCIRAVAPFASLTPCTHLAAVLIPSTASAPRAPRSGSAHRTAPSCRSAARPRCTYHPPSVRRAHSGEHLRREALGSATTAVCRAMLGVPLQGGRWRGEDMRAGCELSPQGLLL